MSTGPFSERCRDCSRQSRKVVGAGAGVWGLEGGDGEHPSRAEGTYDVASERLKTLKEALTEIFVPAYGPSDSRVVETDGERFWSKAMPAQSKAATTAPRITSTASVR